MSLPYISENGAAINGLDLLNSNLPKELILSREKNTILKIFKNLVPINLKNKCNWLSEMDNKNQSLILGLKDKREDASHGTLEEGLPLSRPTFPDLSS